MVKIVIDLPPEIINRIADSFTDGLDDPRV